MRRLFNSTSIPFSSAHLIANSRSPDEVAIWDHFPIESSPIDLRGSLDLPRVDPI
jgi:hypothetical protein